MKNIKFLLLLFLVITLSGCIRTKQTSVEKLIQQLVDGVNQLDKKVGELNFRIEKLEVSQKTLNELSQTMPAVASAKPDVIAQQPAYCISPPVTTDIGGLIYPITTEYSHLPYLGQLFTASECGEDRLSSILGGKDKQYILGSSLTLKKSPSTSLYTVLISLGFICTVKTSPQSCMQWRTDKAIPVNDILRLKPYADEIAVDDCTLCG